MNKALLLPEVQEFIRKNLKIDLSKLILKGSPFPHVSVQEIAAQINGMRRAEKKLPTWFNAEGIIFPPNINLEQTSSEITAKYKASLVSGKEMTDLTGGFGIDSFFFAERFEKLTHCELDPELSKIASHNFKVLGRNNIHTFAGDGIAFLKDSPQKIDLIYLDPARRDDYGGKVFLLEQCTPDVPGNMELLFDRSNKLLIKTSPLLDLKAGILELKNVAEIHIVAVNNEVKELLWLLEKDFAEKEIRIKTVNFLKKNVQEFEAVYAGNLEDAPLSLPGKYLFEPNPAVMKSGLFAEVASQTGTTKLHSNSHLFTSDEIQHFPGRSFKVLEILPYLKKILKKHPAFKKANITTRNFPKTVEDLRKELKIEDGGDSYLFFTTNLNNDKIMLVCEKI
ncbi:class I SAM-dependent methyltransferase [Antarcticibacterium arcticum]|uniref:Class I SAM-dependent methyltransferase n=1 Tax=Antarcticibacterium arcticum TaxID=2585771 RepID=A0A5B8YJG0_9FLAO|nr:class I SAM-dependent methyltransferase [Antarcticibacterium arcticum]QED36977.1 class I SAM-dependent methyltransferase [Antarcticibacterium arcticum]